MQQDGRKSRSGIPKSREIGASPRDARGTGHSVQPFDLVQVDLIPKWMKGIAETTGPLWGVVHSAAMMVIQPLQFLKMAAIEDVLRINLVAAFGLAKGFRQRGVLGDGGSIVFLSSVAAMTAAPGNSAYATSKAGLQALTRTLAIELAPQKIRVNCVAPTWVQTEMTEASAGQSLTAEQLDAITARIPLGTGTPEDVAASVAFLLADSGRWITGTTLVVDGGFLAY